jgi:hypothetical protein
MNDERRTLASLLRTRAVYEDPDTAEPDPRWKEALLADLDLEASVPRPEPAPADPPLRLRHLAVLAPVGVALFLAGYLVGTGGVTAADLARIHPAWWVGIALAVASTSLYRFRRLLRR